MVLRLRGGMQLFVKTITGRTVTLDVEPSDSIESMKVKVQDMTSVPFDKQLIVWQGALLENGYTLSDYNIGHECTIHMVLRPSRNRD